MSNSASIETRKHRLEFNKLQKRLRRNVGRAIADFNMIEEGDKVMVCLSGGKDSYAMLDILLNLQKTAPVHFELVAVNMDQKQPGFPEHILPEYLQRIGVPYHILNKDTYSVVKELVPEGKTTCGLCSRLRRGTLYGFAEEIGATKVALGHHKDDIVETLFLNMFYGGRLKAMPPKLLADDQRNIVIRPLAYCREEDLSLLAEYKQFPIIPCNLCGSQENLQRQNIKAMLRDWDRQFPGRTETIFSALQKVSPSQLADTGLYDFTNLELDRSNEKKAPVAEEATFVAPVVNSWVPDLESDQEPASEPEECEVVSAPQGGAPLYIDAVNL
ncbi:tRNA 2-thiocytidine(32) synthetase TtcA [Biformimicrobium ophioploci]|uniref:tRNA-cytidine(32) 2-sulfurtransferase n=1 Tax=Biformimicrobium ophioploci TaxID=3036711 RepID=A0ABQ6M009_9GAMM|nr:tRNA 2-thiocytidine(32) synthetase TtcA [Microbulbifer sp. NKW57]GMG87622.1 tRNA 2-thiocytidine(32) synthetase TtcA [Microbulbifer sp. NKW57]